MDKKPGDTPITDQDWMRLQQWSDGYDAGWNSSWMVDPTDFFDRGEYVAGFVRAQRDKLETGREARE